MDDTGEEGRLDRRKEDLWRRALAEHESRELAEEVNLRELTSSLATPNPNTSPPPTGSVGIKAHMGGCGVKGGLSGKDLEMNRSMGGSGEKRGLGGKDLDMNRSLEEEDSQELRSTLRTSSPPPSPHPNPADRGVVKRQRDSSCKDDENRRKNGAPEEGEQLDIVSSLPPDLACIIFSRLSTIDSVSTTGVCSTWRGIWLYTPVVLNDVELGVELENSERRMQIIERILETHPGPVRRLKMSCLRLSCSVARFQLWFSSPKFELLDELSLSFPKESRRVHQHLLPHIAFSLPVVRVMTIVNCLIGSGSVIASDRLLSLELRSVGTDSDTLQALMSSCDKLVTLRLLNNFGLKTLTLKLQSLCQLFIRTRRNHELTTLRIGNAKSLKELYMNQFSQGPTVIIKDAPKLSTLGYIGLETPHFQIGHMVFRVRCMACCVVVLLSIKLTYHMYLSC